MDSLIVPIQKIVNTKTPFAGLMDVCVQLLPKDRNHVLLLLLLLSRPVFRREEKLI